MKKDQIFDVYKTSLTKPFKIVLLLCMFIGATSYVNAQQILSLEDLQTELQNNDQGESQHLQHLLEDLVSTAYIDVKGVHVYLKNGQEVQRINTKPDYLQQVYNPGEELKTAKLLEVRLTKEADLTQQLDAGQLSALTNLKYVHILSQIDCDIANVVERMVTGTNESLIIFYNISIPK